VSYQFPLWCSQPQNSVPFDPGNIQKFTPEWKTPCTLYPSEVFVQILGPFFLEFWEFWLNGFECFWNSTISRFSGTFAWKFLHHLSLFRKFRNFGCMESTPEFLKWIVFSRQHYTYSNWLKSIGWRGKKQSAIGLIMH